MHRQPVATVALVLAAACLAGACESSPVQPRQTQTPVEPPTVRFVSVRGFVVEPQIDPGAEAMPVSGATIVIDIDPLLYPIFTLTGADGSFHLASSKGTFNVTVTKEGYETLVKSIEISGDMDLRFELKRAA
jgi:hypothetical protein